MPRSGNKFHLVRNGSLAILAAAAWAIASNAYSRGPVDPTTLEPLPKDPKERIYYGEQYSPEQYAKCLQQMVTEDLDPRIDPCTQYREKLEPLDPKRRDEFGEFYDPAKYHQCRKTVESRDTQCDYLKLRRTPEKAIWPYPEVPEPKWPAAPEPPVYRWWITAKQYFEALCKAEAGEFIYRTVDNVEGVYQIRPRLTQWTYELRDRYVVEDPYGYTLGEAQYGLWQFVSKGRFRFLEVPIERELIKTRSIHGKEVHPSFFLKPDASDKVVRYSEYDGRDLKTLKKEYDKNLRSRYGYTWRGIKRTKDRGLGIAGGELIIVDLRTNEILGVRRGFMRASKSRISRSGLNWETGAVCPELDDRTGWSKYPDFTAAFVLKVLQPANNDHQGHGTERK